MRANLDIETKASTSSSRAGAGPPHLTELSVTGKSCGNCARHVTEALQQVQGVVSASVSLEQQRAAVRWSGQANPDVPALIQAVTNAGYNAKPIASPSAGEGTGLPVQTKPNLWSNDLLIA